MKTLRQYSALIVCAIVCSGIAAQQIELPAVPCVEGPTPVLIGYGERTRACEIDFVGDVDRYVFEGESGDQVWLHLQSVNNNMDPHVTMLGPNDEPVRDPATCVNRCATGPRMTLTESGLHTVIVQDRGNDEGGGYSLLVERVFPSPDYLQDRIPYGGTFPNRMDDPEDLDFFEFDAAAGTTIRIVAEALSDNMDPVLWLLNSAGETITPASGSSCANRCSLVVDFEPPVDDTYLAMIYDSGLDEGGSYAFRLECLTGLCPRRVDVCFEEAGEGCVDVVLSHDVAIRGGELAIAYDSSLINTLTVDAGTDLPDDASVTSEVDLPIDACLSDPDVDRALKVAWVNSQQGDVPTFPGNHRVLRLCAEFKAGASGSLPLRLVDDCVGPTDAPVRNVVTDQIGQPQSILSVCETEIAPPPSDPFRRGDTNGDGFFDVSDAISVLTCRFLDVACPSCEDAADANDDGVIDVADAVYLIAWRFEDGLAPAAPFSTCAGDPTPDGLSPCRQSVCADG